jgi:AsmA-like C-terminal region
VVLHQVQRFPLDLPGSIKLNEARFTNVNVQEKINALSQRGKGQETAGNGPSVVSRLSAEFTLRDGTLTFSDLSFGVPGAIVQLAGTYNLKPETLDLRGNLLLDATLAETTNGWKAVVGRIAQPLFRRQGGGSQTAVCNSEHRRHRRSAMLRNDYSRSLARDRRAATVVSDAPGVRTQSTRDHTSIRRWAAVASLHACGPTGDLRFFGTSGATHGRQD